MTKPTINFTSFYMLSKGNTVNLDDLGTFITACHQYVNSQLETGELSHLFGKMYSHQNFTRISNFDRQCRSCPNYASQQKLPTNSTVESSNFDYRPVTTLDQFSAYRVPFGKNTYFRQICNSVTHLRSCPDFSHLQKTAKLPPNS